MEQSQDIQDKGTDDKEMTEDENDESKKRALYQSFLERNPNFVPKPVGFSIGDAIELAKSRRRQEEASEEPNHIVNEDSYAPNIKNFPPQPNELQYEGEEGEIFDLTQNADSQQYLQQQQLMEQQQHILNQYPQQYQAQIGIEEEFKEGDMQAHAANMIAQQQFHYQHQQHMFQQQQQQQQILQANQLASLNTELTQMVSSQMIAPFMKTKRNAYNIFANEAQYYLPPYDECSLEFLRDVLSGKKRCFKNSQIRIIKVPKLEELTAKKIMTQIRGDQYFQMYLPDLESLKRPLNREYLFNMINTLKPGYFEANIPNAYKQRKENADRRRLQMIEVCNEMLEAIQNSNQRITNQNGRALSMLRHGFKKRKQREPTQKIRYEASVSLAQVDPVQDLLEQRDYGSPRAFKRAKRNHPPDASALDGGDGGFIFLNNQPDRKGAMTSIGSAQGAPFDYSATTTKSRMTIDGSNQSVKQFQFDIGRANQIAQQQQQNNQTTISNTTAKSSIQPQRPRREL